MLPFVLVSDFSGVVDRSAVLHGRTLGRAVDDDFGRYAMTAFLDEAIAAVAGGTARWIRFYHVVSRLSLTAVGGQGACPCHPDGAGIIGHVGPSDTPHGAVFHQSERRALGVRIKHFRD